MHNYSLVQLGPSLSARIHRGAASLIVAQYLIMGSRIPGRKGKEAGVLTYEQNIPDLHTLLKYPYLLIFSSIPVLLELVVVVEDVVVSLDVVLTGLFVSGDKELQKFKDKLHE